MILERISLVDVFTFDNDHIYLTGNTMICGDHGAGKSNLLWGIRFLFLLTKLYKEYEWHEENWDRMIVCNGKSDGSYVSVSKAWQSRVGNFIREGCQSGQIEGTFLASDGRRATITFEITKSKSGSGSGEEWVKMIKAEGFEGFDTASFDADLIILEPRDFTGWQKEKLPGYDGPVIPIVVEQTKRALFLCSTSPSKGDRDKWSEFQRMLATSPFGELVPTMIVNQVGHQVLLDLLINDRLVEELNETLQMWIKIMAMVLIQDAPCILIDGFGEISVRLRTLLRAALWRIGKQVVIATVFPDSCGEVEYTRLERDNNRKVSAIWLEQGKADADAVPKDDPRYLTVLPGGFVRLHPEGLRHLGIGEGATLLASLEEGGVLRIESLKSWLSEENNK